MEQKIKWFNSTEHVDTDTGEILTKSEIERGNYRHIGTEKKTEIIQKNNTKYGHTKYRKLYREHEQKRLF